MWLPAVGALLFLSVGLAWALSTPPKEVADLSAIPATSAAATATATATAVPTVTATAPPAQTAPAPTLTAPRQIGTTIVQPLPNGDKRRR